MFKVVYYMKVAYNKKNSITQIMIDEVEQTVQNCSKTVQKNDKLCITCARCTVYAQFSEEFMHSLCTLLNSFAEYLHSSDTVGKFEELVPHLYLVTLEFCLELKKKVEVSIRHPSYRAFCKTFQPNIEKTFCMFCKFQRVLDFRGLWNFLHVLARYG